MGEFCQSRAVSLVLSVSCCQSRAVSLVLSVSCCRVFMAWTPRLRPQHRLPRHRLPQHRLPQNRLTARDSTARDCLKIDCHIDCCLKAWTSSPSCSNRYSFLHRHLCSTPLHSSPRRLLHPARAPPVPPVPPRRVIPRQISPSAGLARSRLRRHRAHAAGAPSLAPAPAQTAFRARGGHRPKSRPSDDQAPRPAAPPHFCLDQSQPGLVRNRGFIGRDANPDGIRDPFSRSQISPATLPA